MSASEEELEYVLVEIGSVPNAENNQMPNPVLMSEGEAEFTNNFLESNDSPSRYVKLQQED